MDYDATFEEPEFQDVNKKDFQNRVFKENFTILSDAITSKVGLFESAVFGFIYRRALKEGYSYCSKKSISKGLNINFRTVDSAVKKLIDLDLIVDTTPEKFTSKTQVRYYSVLIESYNNFTAIWEKEEKENRLEKNQYRTSEIAEMARKKLEEKKKNLENE